MVNQLVFIVPVHVLTTRGTVNVAEYVEKFDLDLFCELDLPPKFESNLSHGFAAKEDRQLEARQLPATHRRLYGAAHQPIRHFQR